MEQLTILDYSLKQIAREERSLEARLRQEAEAERRSVDWEDFDYQMSIINHDIFFLKEAWG